MIWMTGLKKNCSTIKELIRNGVKSKVKTKCFLDKLILIGAFISNYMYPYTAPLCCGSFKS